MNILRYHWFDIGIVCAVVVAAFLLFFPQSGLALILWVSLISLFLHQFEEYRYPGNFPGMMNSVMFASQNPDRYPLNANTALIINLGIGWLTYLLAALFGERLIWLAIAAILISVGNFIAHTFLFNVKCKTIYNPGMLTAVLLFLPISVYFFLFVVQRGLASPLDWLVGIVLGIALNYVGILKMIDWLKDPNTPYVFPARFLPPNRASDT